MHTNNPLPQPDRGRRTYSVEFITQLVAACRIPSMSVASVAREHGINHKAETALARVVQVFGAAHPHHAYLFANQRANRMKVLLHDGVGAHPSKRLGDRQESGWRCN